jgi:hypothetical protein
MGRLKARSGGARRCRRGGAAADGGGSPGKACKRAPSLDFERGLHGEIAGSTGNPSRGFGGSGIDQSGCAAVSGGSGRTARSREHKKARKRGKERPVRILTTT